MTHLSPDEVTADPLPGASGREPAASVRERPAILLLDDDPFMLAVQSRALRGMGYEHVSTACSAAAALASLRHRDTAHGIDIVICDLNMPGMDGIEFLQALSAEKIRIPVILLSGEGARILHTVQQLLGGSGLVLLGVLQKPASKAALRALIEAWRPAAQALPASKPLDITQAEVVAASLAQQWAVHYQPKVDLKTGAVRGVEALIRWQHPRHGLVYPDHFITLAENCGAIDAMTQWMLRTVMTQSVTWRSQHIVLNVAINLCIDSLYSPAFAADVAAIARSTGAEPCDVTLEITESRLMSKSSVSLANLVRLRLQRFHLSIDDFGTGHSSLAQLRDLPFTELKVDRGFVHGARSDQIIRPILEGSIGMGKRLGMTVVAEGVETEDDWQLLRELDCDLAQGYFIARPMPAEHLPRWLAQWDERRRSLGTS